MLGVLLEGLGRAPAVGGRHEEPISAGGLLAGIADALPHGVGLALAIRQQFLGLCIKALGCGALAGRIADAVENDGVDILPIAVGRDLAAGAGARVDGRVFPLAAVEAVDPAFCRRVLTLGHVCRVVGSGPLAGDRCGQAKGGKGRWEDVRL